MTTNSDGGIESYEAYYPIFAEMEKQDMVLNLHVIIVDDDIWDGNVRGGILRNGDATR